MTPQAPPRIAQSRLRQLQRLASEPYAFFEEAYRALGPIFVMHVFGQEPWVMLGDPEAVRTVFRASADEVLADADGIKYLLGPHTILFLDGEAHRRERRVLTPPFKHERMTAYAERMIARSDDAIDALRPGERRTAQSHIVDVTLEVIVECVFGVASKARRRRLATLVERHLTAMQTGGMAVASMAMGGERFRALLRRGTDLVRPFARTEGPVPEGPASVARFLRNKAEMDAMLSEEVRRCRAAPEGRDDVLSMLVSAEYDDGSGMHDAAIVDELFALLLGGHETSAITLSWAIYFLSTHPEALRAARAEIDATFGDGPVTARKAERLRYLPAVIDETMRLRPVATSLPRKLACETTLGGFTLPAGTRVFPAPALLHFRDDLWPEAQAFRPERFLDAKASPFQYMPFGGGSRACLGRPFAQLEMKLVLANFLHRVDHHLDASAAPVPVFRGLLVGPSDGVPIVIDRVRPRLTERAGMPATAS